MLQVYTDAEALARAAAQLLVSESQAASRVRGRFSVALSGGQTPKRTFELLAQPPFRDQVPWGHVHVFWGDERCVPPDDPRSNYRMTKEALLDHVPLQSTQVHRIQGEKPPVDAALEYQTLLQQFFHGAAPRFDLVYLGLGDNGHTASLFPGTPVLEDTKRWVAEVYVAEQGMYRVTLTAPVINQAAVISFLVAGAGKAQVLEEVIHGPHEPRRLPAQLIRPANGGLLWMADQQAAARVKAEAP